MLVVKNYIVGTICSCALAGCALAQAPRGPIMLDAPDAAVAATFDQGAVLEDLAVTIHPHPTLSETLPEGALAALARLDRNRAKEIEKQITSP